MFLDERPGLGDIVGFDQGFEIDKSGVAAICEQAVLVEHVGDASAHPGREVAAGGSQDHDPAASHVFATMIPDALDDRVSAAVAHTEALGRDAAEEALAGRGAVEHNVADQDLLFGAEA